MKKTIIGVVGACSVIVVAIVIAVMVFFNGTDEYREIKIYKVDGSAEVERGEDMVIDAYENMQLQSEDAVNVNADSYTQLKMDEDKYALLEPDTRIRIEATGNADDSKTSIYLEKGSIVSHIDKPLSEKSSYEVNTPNSTMAVRGTSFRVTTYYDEDGESHTVLEVIEGRVECFLVYPDGSKSKGTVFTAGTKVEIRGDNLTSEYVYDDGVVDLNELNIPVLDFLKIHFNEKYFCNEEELNLAIEAKNNSQPDEDSSDNSYNEDTHNTNNNSSDGTGNNSDTDNPEDIDEDNVDSGDDDNTDNGDSDEEKGTEDNKSAEKKNDSESNEYTVTFYYNGQVFATQSVKGGDIITEPSLCPSPTGYWEYDFNNPIEADTSIEWRE